MIELTREFGESYASFRARGKAMAAGTAVPDPVFLDTPEGRHGKADWEAASALENVPRCAHCGLPAGRTPDGEDLGPLDAVELHDARREGREASPAALAEEAGKRLAHAGCVHALRAYRPAGGGALAPGGFPRPAGGLTVHVFESYGYLPLNEAGTAMRARCGLTVALAGSRVEWTVVADDSPNLCQGCRAPRDPRARAFPALLPEGPRS